MAEQTKIAALAAIVTVAVFTVMGATLYFHAKKRTFSKETIKLLQWLIKVLLYLFIVAGLNGFDLRIISTLLR